jgi:hypothetical protein
MVLPILHLPKQRGEQGLREPMAGLSWGGGALGLAPPRASFICLRRVSLHLNDQDAVASAGLDVSAGFPGFPCLRWPRSTSHEGSGRSSRPSPQSLHNTTVYPDRHRPTLLRARRAQAPARGQSKCLGSCPRRIAARQCLPARALCTWSWPVAVVTRASQRSGRHPDRPDGSSTGQ